MNYTRDNLSFMIRLRGLSDLAEEILSLMRKKGKVEIREIHERFNSTKETSNQVIDFLVEFGFAELDETKRYIRLSKACKKFLERTER